MVQTQTRERETQLPAAPETGTGKKRNYLNCAAAFGAVFLLFAAAVNISSFIALPVYEVPVMGTVARFLTFRDYRWKQVGTPAPSTVTSTTEPSEKVYGEIRLRLKKAVAEGEQRAAEYKQAYLQAGGKEEAYVPPKIYADYELLYSDAALASFVIRKWDSQMSYPEQTYYSVELSTGKELTLPDVLGDDYKRMVNDAVTRQIREWNTRDPAGCPYLIREYQGASANMPFYINRDNEVVVVFKRYEIANGAGGEPAFIIGPVSRASR